MIGVIVLYRETRRDCNVADWTRRTLMALIGENLKAPKFAAIALGVYAIGYASLLLIAGVGAISNGPIALLFFGMLALAATPFIALTHLNRITEVSERPPARPVIMTFVMAAPAAFWLYWGFGSLVPLHYIQVDQLFWLFVFLSDISQVVWCCVDLVGFRR